LQNRIKNLGIPHEKSLVCDYLTVSVGVYVLECGKSKDIDAIYKSADQALYTAKESGRNRAFVTDGDFEFEVTG
jgi:diguanylate cyclase (GGDEF)-like protein